ncbi:MAG: glycoside hydrolase family 65 protein [Coprococcus sp.]|nr:glycoside hydrolase family 65 protein [Coprococcus sp.]
MIRERFSKELKEFLSDDQWMILQEDYKPEENLKYESLFCLANGYLGTRGSYEEGTIKSLPYTYINGVFDQSETFMRELAALPNWLTLKIYVEKELIGLENCEILSFARALNMRSACLVKQYRLRDKKGRETLIEGVRFVSRAHEHRMAVKIFVTPLNYEGIIEIENIIDGTVINFCDAPRFKVKHTYLTANEKLEEKGAYLEAAARDNHLHVGCGAYTNAKCGGKDVIKTVDFHAFGEQAVEFLDFDAKEGVTAEITKYVSMYTERDVKREEIKSFVQKEIQEFAASGFEKEFLLHKSVYEKLWQEADIRIKGDFDLDRAIRFNVFHLMSTANDHDDRINIGAKLLHGEEYGGHAFWDTELFMMPFFAWVFPKTAQNLENYRYHLLDAAKANAAKNGFAGAQYPWESADDGSEQCPDWTIEPDGTCYRCYVAVYEHHVTAAVAYGIANYVKITGDTQFLLDKGAWILVETARFWASRCQYVEEKDRYEIHQVTGPDEWHEPVDNNLYTNYLARWNLRYVRELTGWMEKEYPEQYHLLVEESALTEEELKKWDTVQEKLYLPRKEGTALLEQFEGYFDLMDVTIEKYDKNDWPIKPEILKRVGKQETQIIKQADVVMLLHLLDEEFDEETKRLNYHYYEKRTLHGSSLSPSVYAVMGLKTGDPSKAYRYLRRAAFIDLVDLQGNTREGIHAANAGGVWQTVIFGFAGISIEEGVLHVDPRLPKEWEGITFRLHHKGAWIEVSISGAQEVSLSLLEGEEVQAVVKGEIVKVQRRTV